MTYRSMPFLALLLGAIAAVATSTGALAATALHVDANNTTVTNDGTAHHPYATIQTALSAAVAGDTVLVAKGTYAENVVIEDKQITLRGGYRGGSVADYTNNLGGDFATQVPTANITQVQASVGTAAILLVGTQAAGSVIDGFVICGGIHGIELDDSITFPRVNNVTISNNVIEGNGVAEYEHVGGGIRLSGDGHTVQDNIIRNNIGGRGAGVSMFGENITLTRNTVENNVGYADHAGGIYQGGTAIITENTIRNNRIGETLGYGWGGGILILGTATLRHNTYISNHAPSIGGAFFVDDGGMATLEHELMFANSAAIGAAIYIDGYGDDVGSHLDITNCTIVGNTADDTPVGNTVYIERNSSATLLNTIAWGNQGDDFFTDETSSILVTYSISEEPIAGIGNLNVDPLFANAGLRDYHLKSTNGRYNPLANGGAGGFDSDAVDSPAIDAGAPSSDFSLEPPSNGGRINMGVFGNTAEASKSRLDACPSDALFGQPPALDKLPVSSDSISGFRAFESFSGVTAPIAAVEFWVGAGDCVRDPDQYSVALYTDNGGLPSLAVRDEVITPDAFPTGVAINGVYNVTRYVATFATPVELAAGWVSIYGVNESDCSAGWVTSDVGDGSVQELGNVDFFPIDFDVAVCLLPVVDLNAPFQTADQDQNGVINLSELLRCIQFYNAGGLHCADDPGDTEDGYVPGPGAKQSCVPHDTDYAPQDWKIGLSELLRLIQFYNFLGYHVCPGENTEDGFCPGG